MDFLETPIDIAKQVSINFRKYRKKRHITMKELSARSGVSYPSLKRFEYTGEISFTSLVKLAYILGAEDEIKALFSSPVPTSIEELF